MRKKSHSICPIILFLENGPSYPLMPVSAGFKEALLVRLEKFQKIIPNLSEPSFLSDPVSSPVPTPQIAKRPETVTKEATAEVTYEANLNRSVSSPKCVDEKPDATKDLKESDTVGNIIPQKENPGGSRLSSPVNEDDGMFQTVKKPTMTTEDSEENENA